MLVVFVSLLYPCSSSKALKRKYHEKNHVGSVRCVASGGHYLASGGTDETIK